MHRQGLHNFPFAALGYNESIVTQTRDNSIYIDKEEYTIRFTDNVESDYFRKLDETIKISLVVPPDIRHAFFDNPRFFMETHYQKKLAFEFSRLTYFIGKPYSAYTPYITFLASEMFVDKFIDAEYESKLEQSVIKDEPNWISVKNLQIESCSQENITAKLYVLEQAEDVGYFKGMRIFYNRIFCSDRVFCCSVVLLCCCFAVLCCFVLFCFVLFYCVVVLMFCGFLV